MRRDGQELQPPDRDCPERRTADGRLVLILDALRVTEG